MLLLLLQRGIDVLMNKESKRETPAVVSFGDKMRFIGTDGAGKISMNPKNTPHQLKRLLGKQFKDPAVQVGWGTGRGRSARRVSRPAVVLPLTKAPYTTSP